MRTHTHTIPLFVTTFTQALRPTQSPPIHWVAEQLEVKQPGADGWSGTTDPTSTATYVFVACL